MSKILILKNDRAGDLMTSLKLISSLNIRNNYIKIYLSELNSGFSFFFKNIEVSNVKYNLSVSEKIKILFDIYKNNYDKIYILSPKQFYFFLPIIFRKIKFYSIVYNNKRNRPNNFLRKYLYNYKIIYRNKINKKSYRDLQLELLDDNIKVDENFTGLNIPKIPIELKNLIPKKFIYFQFRYLFFKKLGWGINEFELLMKEILTKYENILFSSDNEMNEETKRFNKYFINNYSIIDTNSNFLKINKKKKNIFYLNNIGAKNLFFICKESEINLAKEGIISHISYFHNRKCHNLFNFDINNLYDFKFQKISYSEWSKGMKMNFSFLNSDINKSIRKILRNI